MDTKVFFKEKEVVFLLYRLLTPFGAIVFSTCFRLKVEGVENVPKDGALIICPNHLHNLDPVIVAVAMRKIRPIRFMAKSELFKNKWISSFLRKLGAFPVQRGQGDRQALKMASSILKNEECLGIFPEGRRSKGKRVETSFTGVATFALKYDAQVIPVAIKGDYTWFKPMVVSFGEPVNIDHYRNEKVSSDQAKEVMDVIVREMNNLLQND